MRTWQFDREGDGWAKPFFTIWSGQAFSLFGSNLVQFALVWWLTQATHSATVLATATLVAVLPRIIIGPLGGPLVDRWDRRRVMLTADALVALSTAALVMLVLAGRLEVWHVYLAMSVRAAGESFHWTAMLASTALMVPERHLARVAGANQTLGGAMNIISPPMGALLLQLLPLPGVLCIDILSAALAVIPLLLIAIPKPERSATSAEGRAAGSYWGELAAGVRYVSTMRGMLGLVGVFMLINFIIDPTISLLPLWVIEHFGGGALHLGALESAWGVGVVLGGLLLGAWGGFRRRVVTTLTGVVVMGCGCALAGLVPSHLFPLAVAVLFIVGLTNPLINGPFMALIQTRVAADMQGRVLGLLHSGTAAMLPLGLAAAGPLSDAIGVRAWLFGGGILCAVLALVSLATPALRNMEDAPSSAPAGGRHAVVSA